MSITFSCYQCSQRYEVDKALAGKAIRCKRCGAVVEVPLGGEDLFASAARRTTPAAPNPPADDLIPFDELEDAPSFGPEEDPDFRRPRRPGPAGKAVAAPPGGG